MIDPRLKACLLTVGADILEDGRPHTIHLAEKLWSMAVEGDLKAMKLILEYVIGRPAQTIRNVSELTRDVDEETRVALERVYGAGSQRTNPDRIILKDPDRIILPEGN